MSKGLKISGECQEQIMEPIQLRQLNKGKAAANKRMKREALLNTAYELFVQKGVPGTSIHDITEKAGVAKGTFYLYFKDKYDIRDRLIRHKATQILEKGYEDMSRTGVTALEDRVVFLADNVIRQLSENRILLKFISKNLSWGMFKRDLQAPALSGEDEINLLDSLNEGIRRSGVKYKDPEIMLYLIIELIGAACYNCVVNNEPCSLDDLRPYLMNSIRAIMRSMEVTSAAS